MSEMLRNDPAWLSERGRVIATYALCGFANFGSIGVQIGGYSSLAPSRRPDLARLALRAMLGGLIATSLVACVAGVLL
jgi:CNT family concentrative nucleoside transporter